MIEKNNNYLIDHPDVIKLRRRRQRTSSPSLLLNEESDTCVKNAVEDTRAFILKKYKNATVIESSTHNGEFSLENISDSLDNLITNITKTEDKLNVKISTSLVVARLLFKVVPNQVSENTILDEEDLKESTITPDEKKINNFINFILDQATLRILTGIMLMLLVLFIKFQITT